MPFTYSRSKAFRPISLLEYRNKEMRRASGAFSRMVRAGDARGLMFIVDRGSKSVLIGASGSYRKNPALALAEAKKLVSMLCSIETARKRVK